MRRFAGWMVLALFASFALTSLLSGTRPAAAQPPGMPPGGGRPGMGFGGMPPDSFAQDRDSLLTELRQHYSDRLDAPAESVFKNIKVFKGRSVKQVLGAMDGFGHALGVPCNHCHVLGHWADEDKKPKEAARGMIAMVGRINEELLPDVKGLQSEHPHVGCFTCHHGQARPGAMGGRPGGMGGPGGPGGMNRPGDNH